jgi:spermidine/putrescine transport system ATP-binding protein
MTMADTVAVMNKGRIEQLGAPEVLYELPKTVFVANFLGQSNLFSGEVTSTSADAITVGVPGGSVVVPKSRAHRHTGTVTVGVRPEKLSMHESEPERSSGRNLLGPGRVTDVSFSGVSTQYLVEIPGAGNVVVFAQNIGFGPLVNLGAEVWVSWQVDHGFGLDDDAEPTGRFPADADTQAIAAQRRRALSSELEGA